MSNITGPYVDGAFFNKPGETIFVCVSCANERDIPEENAIMYDEGPQYMECYDCGSVIRDLDN
jgi:hypothetical protein